MIVPSTLKTVHQKKSNLEKVQEFISSYASSDFVFNSDLKNKLVKAVGGINGSYFTITDPTSVLSGYTTVEHDMSVITRTKNNSTQFASPIPIEVGK